MDQTELWAVTPEPEQEPELRKLLLCYDDNLLDNKNAAIRITRAGEQDCDLGQELFLTSDFSSKTKEITIPRDVNKISVRTRAVGYFFTDAEIGLNNSVDVSTIHISIRRDEFY